MLLNWLFHLRGTNTYVRVVLIVGTEDQRILVLSMVRSAEVPLMAAVDHRGRLVYVNTQLANALGHKLKALKNKDITIIMPQPHGALHMKYIRVSSTFSVSF